MSSSRKRKSLGVGNNIAAWFGDKVQKIPNGIIFVAAVLSMIFKGWILSEYNSLVSKIVSSGITMALFKTLVMINVGVLIADRSNMLTMKSLSTKLVNKEYAKITQRCINSKVSAINEITTGKITDTIRELVMFKWNNVSYIFNMIPCIIPFSALIIKEWKYNKIMTFVSVLGVVLSAVLVLLNEKVFGWSKQAKDAKGKLRSVTTDNFMNLTTFKFIHETNFPMVRLIREQCNCFKYEMNVVKMFIYGLSLAAMWTPTLINVYLGRGDIEIVAYILMTDYILQNVSGQIVNYVDNKIEINSSEKVLENLKGDDVDEHIEFHGERSLDGCSFKHVETINETIYQEEHKRETIFRVDKFTLKENKRYLVKGKSGEGKSSFLAWLAGMLVTIEGECPNLLTYYVWQETSLYNDTLINNIIPDVPVSERQKYMDKIEYFANRLDMTFVHDELPEGWNTLCGERGYLLSSGQKQRVNIIRTLLAMTYHPEYVFLLDEITSNLDTKTKRLAIELINETCKSTLIIVSHNAGFEKMIDYNVNVTNHTIRMNEKKTNKPVLVAVS